MPRPKSFWHEMGTNPNKKHRPKGILYPCIDFTQGWQKTWFLLKKPKNQVFSVKTEKTVKKPAVFLVFWVLTGFLMVFTGFLVV